MRRILYVCSSTKNGATQAFFQKSFEIKPCDPLEIGFAVRPACLTDNYGWLGDGVVKDVNKDAHDGTETDWIEVSSPTENLRACLTKDNGWCEVILPSR